MKNVLVVLLIALVTFKGFAQEDTSNIDQRVITTGVPFMLIAGDARSSGMGDIGVSSALETPISPIPEDLASPAININGTPVVITRWSIFDVSS
jgi:uncharacterized membrane protein